MIDSQKFIVCKGTSGMGNRILAACTALLYGEIAGRKVVIDWRDNSYSENEAENAFPNYFDCPTAYSVADIPETQSVFPELWIGNLDKSLGRLRGELNLKGYSEMSFDVSSAEYAEAMLVFCAYTHKIKSLRPLFKGTFEYFKDMTTPEILRSILSSKLHLVKEIYDPIYSYKAKNFSTNTIGVHVRYTDIKVPLTKLISNVKRLVDKNKDATVFLATDSQTVVEQLQQKLPRVVTADKWFPPQGERMHQNWDNCPNRYQNGVEALTDLYLLSECDSLVFSSQSSFGYVASLLSKADPRQIYDVEIDDSLLARLQRRSQKLTKLFAAQK
ncbi:MAG: nodulation protein NodZ [Leptolyngbyaceae cyanobacterium]